MTADSPDAGFTSGVVRRLAGRGGSYGRYRLKGEMARGGQGAILRVWDEDLVADTDDRAVHRVLDIVPGSPADEAGLLSIKGVGPGTAERYGAAILELVRRHGEP